VKLAQAGIDENVMLSFIDNSGMFNLGADQVIYLSDLGVSSEVVGEMLRHDAEVIAGTRSLTISSEPPRDPSIKMTFATSSPEAPKVSAQPAAATASPAVVTGRPMVVPDEQSITEPNTTATNSWQSTTGFVKMDEGTPFDWESPEEQMHSTERIGGYPVREPYPVPVTAPIIFVPVTGPTPNTIVIEWFSETNH
jgi:hypothetical protein